MLRGFLLSGALRGYAIAAGFAVQLLLANITSKMAFGQINTFISTILLLTFFVTSAPTRQLVRELGAFGLAERGRLADEFISNAHLWIILSAVIATVAALIKQTHLALIVFTVGLTFTTSLYSSYFRGVGRYVIGNIEAGVIRSTAFILIIMIATLFDIKLTATYAELFYIFAVVIGLITLVLARGCWPSMEFSRRTLWPYKGFPLTLTILAGLEVFSVNFDIIVTTYLYGADLTAEVRVAQQLRSLTLLPLQVYLMFSLDRLSRTLQTGVDTSVRRQEIILIRFLLASTFIAAVALADQFGNMFFEEGTDFLTTIAVLSGVLPVVLFGPRAEAVIAAVREHDQKIKAIAFLLAYSALTPILCWAFAAPPFAYFFGQAAISAFFFASLPKTI